MNDEMDKNGKYQLRVVQRRLIGLVEGARECLREIEEVIGPVQRWDRPDLAVADLYDMTPVHELELSMRAAHCLEHEGVKTVGELLSKSDHELLRLNNFGKKSLFELKEALAAHKARRAADGAGAGI